MTHRRETCRQTVSRELLVDSGQIPSLKATGGHRRLMRGTVVALSLKKRPWALPPSIQMPPKAADLPACDKQQPLTVLVVAYDIYTSAGIKNLFAESFPGVNLLLPTNALDCLLILERHLPHILIADPGMKSFGGDALLLQMVTQQPQYQLGAVVVVLNMGQHEAEWRKTPLPSVLVLPKPFDLQRLRGFVDAHVHMLCHQSAKRPEAAPSAATQPAALAVQQEPKNPESVGRLGCVLDLDLVKVKVKVETKKPGAVTGAVLV